MPYIPKKEKTTKLDHLAQELTNMYHEFLLTGNAKYLNYVLTKAALQGVHNCNSKTKGRYETWRKIKSVQQDSLDEFKNRMGMYESEARKKNGDII